MSFDLFENEGAGPVADAPLAERMRPRSMDDILGQEHLTDPDRLLGRIARGAPLPSLVFWGPPGTGKTTLARVLASAADAQFIGVSAVAAGVREIRQAAERAEKIRPRKKTILFLDEIHRFNKAQQDALLGHVESGLLTLIGATTENPSFELNAALLSRCRVLVLRTLTPEALAVLARRALSDSERGLGSHAVEFEAGCLEALLEGADGDARRLLNALEGAVALGARDGNAIRVGALQVRDALQRSVLRYDRAGEEHFNLASALQKSVRASDPQASVYWCVRMLEAGEDPLYVARRLVRMAVEDVGLADPDALVQAMAAKDAVHFLGLPEGGAALVSAAIYLALAPKSNRAAASEVRAREVIERTGSLPVPMAFRNAVTGLMRELGYGAGYRYDHDAPDGIAGQSGLPEEIREERFYDPAPRGREADLGERMRDLDARRSKKPNGEGAS